MKTRLYSALKFTIGWPLSVLAFFFIGKIILDKAPEIQSHIHTINLQLLFWGILSFLPYYFLRSLIWQRILKNFGYPVSLRESNYLWAMSELKRYIPGKVWAFLGRAVVFHRKGVGKKEIAKGMIIELELFTIGCVIVSFLALPYLLPMYNKFIEWTALFVIACIVIIYAFLNIVFHKKSETNSNVQKNNDRNVSNFEFRILNLARNCIPPFAPGETLLLITISSVGLLFYGLGNYFVISSLTVLDPQLLPQLIGIFVFTFLAGFLSFVTPAGFGVREGLLIVMLNRIINTGVAAFAALFSRLLLIISELIYVGLSSLWLKLKNHRFERVEKWISLHPYETVVICLAVIYTIYFSTISMLRYDHFYAGRFDLGNMAQTVWNTSVGNFFMLTDPNGTREVSRLAFHADFLLILLAPFYWIWPDPRMILIVQTVVVAAGAYFVYLIAQKVLGNKLLGVILAFAYLINPSVQRVNIYDFHAPALATTFLLGTYYFYLKKKYLWFVVFAVLAAFCKEQIWAIIALFGIFLMVHHKKWIFGAAVFFISAGMFYFLVSYAIPQTLGSDHFALKYYAEFGDSPSEVIRTFIFSPDKVVNLLMEEERTKYIKQLFSPLGYLSWLAPWMLLFAGPDLMINLMSSNPQLHYIYYQYTAAITPFIFIAAIYGIWVLKWASLRAAIWRRSNPPRLLNRVGDRRSLTSFGLAITILYILYHSLNAAYLYGPLPGSKEPNIAMMTKPEKNRVLIDETIASIPQEAKVSASNNIASHFSDRRHIYVLPNGIDQSDYVVFLINHTQTSWSLTDEKALLEKLKKDPQYNVLVEKDGFVVLKNSKL